MENEVTISLLTREVVCNGVSKQLTPNETDILALLLSTPHEPVTYQCIAKNLWNVANYTESDHTESDHNITSSIRKVIAGIRKKISGGAAKRTDYIRTIRRGGNGIILQGYIMQAHVTKRPDGSYRLRPPSFQGLETVSIAFRHRLKKEHFIQKALAAACGDILIVNVMNTQLTRGIEKLLRSRNQRGSRIRVLVWKPHRNLYDDAEFCDIISQVDAVTDGWMQLQERFSDTIEVCFCHGFPMPMICGFVVNGNLDSG
ncbi:MAG: Transcriptional regulatory protein terminal [Candidatus Parcubacteria bacterium]|jgi:DNA-binding winged helix-turn-helix (wHTH) protein